MDPEEAAGLMGEGERGVEDGEWVGEHPGDLKMVGGEISLPVGRVKG